MSAAPTQSGSFKVNMKHGVSKPTLALKAKEKGFGEGKWSHPIMGWSQTPPSTVEGQDIEGRQKIDIGLEGEIKGSVRGQVESPSLGLEPDPSSSVILKNA